jgi:hypothetical protein
LGIGISITCAFIFLVILILYPFIKKVPVLRKWIMIDGKPLPEIASAEYMAEIANGDIGSDDTDTAPASILTDADVSKYGKLRYTEKNTQKPVEDKAIKHDVSTKTPNPPKNGGKK